MEHFNSLLVGLQILSKYCVDKAFFDVQEIDSGSEEEETNLYPYYEVTLASGVEVSEQDEEFLESIGWEAPEEIDEYLSFGWRLFNL